MIYPALVYRCPGAFGRPGGTYSYLGVEDSKAEEQALKDGWFKTLPEAIDAYDNKGAISIVKSVPVSDRKSLEAKAKELGIKFDGRNSDKKLKELIEKAA